MEPQNTLLIRRKAFAYPYDSVYVKDCTAMDLWATDFPFMSCTVFEETSTGLNWEGGLNDVFVLQIKQTGWFTCLCARHSVWDISQFE